eukprot:1574378-Amphidinium_carterae.2
MPCSLSMPLSQDAEGLLSPTRENSALGDLVTTRGPQRELATKMPIHRSLVPQVSGLVHGCTIWQ